MYIIKNQNVSRPALRHARSFWGSLIMNSLLNITWCRNKRKICFSKRISFELPVTCLDLFGSRFLGWINGRPAPFGGQPCPRSLSSQPRHYGWIHQVAKWILFSLIGGFRRTLWPCDLVAPCGGYSVIHKGLTVNLFCWCLGWCFELQEKSAKISQFELGVNRMTIKHIKKYSLGVSIQTEKTYI